MYTYSCFPCTTCRCSLQFFHAALQWVTNLVISYNWHQLIYLIHLFIFAHMCFCMYSCICVFPNLCIYCFSACMIIFDYLYIFIYTHVHVFPGWYHLLHFLSAAFWQTSLPCGSWQGGSMQPWYLESIDGTCGVPQLKPKGKEEVVWNEESNRWFREDEGFMHTAVLMQLHNEHTVDLYVCIYLHLGMHGTHSVC